MRWKVVIQLQNCRFSKKNPCENGFFFKNLPSYFEHLQYCFSTCKAISMLNCFEVPKNLFTYFCIRCNPWQILNTPACVFAAC